MHIISLPNYNPGTHLKYVKKIKYTLSSLGMTEYFFLHRVCKKTVKKSPFLAEALHRNDPQRGFF